MLLSLVKRGHPVDFIFSHDTAVFHAVRPLMPSWHDCTIPPAGLRQCLARGLPHCSEATALEGCPGGKGRRAHRVTGACRCGEDSVPGVDPDIGPRVAALRTGAMRHLPTLRQACTRPADHKEPSVSVAPSLPDCGDRPASASAGTSSRREHRNSLSTSERRIDVLLPKLRQGALVRPQYEGTCRTCSAWRYNSLRGPPMRMPQWRHRLLNRCLARRSPPKLPSMPAGETRRRHKRGYSRWTRLFRHRLITDATGC
ncbi:hypothetical protein TcBrA4_0099490 [Trypanosoma cruzi]|nr:hypothetical protein TcBrA4_0099490 [Trypanosoma cruzi]